MLIENLLSVVNDRALASFYRTSAGAEVDLVLEFPGSSKIWVIAIKRELAEIIGKSEFYDFEKDVERRITYHYPFRVTKSLLGILYFS
ncbi:MAG: hypothetical protein JKY67_13590 [Pseudomonadales bacterium]|nr:hypothetical protein [Pseudomonadales bacterium]